MSFLAIEDLREELRSLNAEAMNKTVEELARQLRVQIKEELEAFFLKLTESVPPDSPKGVANIILRSPSSPAGSGGQGLREFANSEFDRQISWSDTSSSEEHYYDSENRSMLHSQSTFPQDANKLVPKKARQSLQPAPTLRSGRWMSGILSKAKNIGKKDREQVQSDKVEKTAERHEAKLPTSMSTVTFDGDKNEADGETEMGPTWTRDSLYRSAASLPSNMPSRKSIPLRTFRFEEFMLQHRRDDVAANLMATEPMDGEHVAMDLRPSENGLEDTRVQSIRAGDRPVSVHGMEIGTCVAMRRVRSTRVNDQCQPLLIRPPPAAPRGTLASANLYNSDRVTTPPFMTSRGTKVRPSEGRDNEEELYETVRISDRKVSHVEKDSERRDSESRIILPGAPDQDERMMESRPSEMTADAECTLAEVSKTLTPDTRKGNTAVLHRNTCSEAGFYHVKSGRSNKVDARPEHPRLKKMQKKGTLSPNIIRKARCISCAYKFILNPWFDFVISLFVVANTVTGGIAVDYKARHLSEPVPVALRVFEIFFCTVFVIEILLRLAVTGRRFFTMPGWQWNWFDFLVVFFQVVDEFVLAVIDDQRSGAQEGTNKSSSLRLLRVVRMIRVLRFARILRLIQELHTLVSAIVSSMKSFLWTVFLLFMINYLFAVFITDMVADHRQALLADDKPDVSRHMKFYWGNLGYSILSLYESVSGGVDWDTVLRPLMEDIHPILMALIFSSYISFSCLVILNLVTGLFVSSAKSTIEENKHFHLVTQLREMFMSSDLDGSGTITWEEFETQLDNPLMEELFKVIQMDLSEARGFFSLLDLDGSGKVNAEQFVMGCLRLRGNAKAIDMTTLMAQTKQSMTWQVSALSKMDKRLGRIEKWLGGGRTRQTRQVSAESVNSVNPNDEIQGESQAR